MNNTLDLRQTGIVNWFFNHDVIYPITFQNIVNLDTNYILEFDNGVTYEVGSGVTITGNNITISVDTAQFQNNRTYKGVFKSEQRIAGVYLNILVNLTINDARK